MNRIFPHSIFLLREKLGESQEKFGQRFPVTGATIGRWERGEHEPQQMPKKELLRLMKQYEISAKD